MIRFIEEHRDRYGVEFLCRALRAAVRGFLTSRGYRAVKARSASAAQLRDELLMPEIQQLHAKHYGVYGRLKMHALLKREGWGDRPRPDRASDAARRRAWDTEIKARVHHTPRQSGDTAC
ncbi:IS3 family transposase [Leucobacter edaphi]|uniref:IS3 family transposase n=1 Tax=Leucobacter edaphi TaxID=2796472 RepID=UPI0034E2A303